VGEREKEEEQLTNSSIEKLFGSAVSETSTIGIHRSAVTLS
jgi:hypothetical protein